MIAVGGGLSFTLADVEITDEKDPLIKVAQGEADEVTGNYNMGLITNN